MFFANTEGHSNAYSPHENENNVELGFSVADILHGGDASTTDDFPIPNQPHRRQQPRNPCPKKQLKTIRELTDPRKIIYGHFTDDTKKQTCDCLSKLILQGGDDKWLVDRIHAVRKYICQHVSNHFGDPEHLKFMKEMIISKFVLYLQFVFILHF